MLDSESRGFVVGFLLRRTEKEIEFKGTDGERFTVPASDVHNLTQQPGTIMPDLLLETFKEQDVADLLSYLCNLKLAPQAIREWLVAGPFPQEDHAGFDTQYGPEKQFDLKAKYANPKGTDLTWQRYKSPVVENEYFVEFDRLTSAGSGAFVAYLYTNVESPSAQSTTLALRSKAAVKVFLNGQVIFSQHRHPLSKHGAIRVTLPLRAGKNDLMLKLERSESGGELTAQLESGEAVTPSVPER